MAKPAVVTEKRVKAKISKLIEIYAKHNSLYSFCPMTFGYGESGHPDRVLLIKSTFIGIEVKKDANNPHSRPTLKPKPSEVMQKRQAEKITKAGGVWLCVHNDNLQELITVLDAHCQTPSPHFPPADVELLEKLKG